MAAAKEITLTPAFLQYPPCNYAVTNTITWTIPVIAADTDAIVKVTDYKIKVLSTVLSINGQHTVKIANAVTYNDRGTAQTFNPEVSFVVDIKDPCKTSTITAVSLNAMTVVLGESASQNFNEVVDSAETTYGLNSCGTRLYKIVK